MLRTSLTLALLSLLLSTTDSSWATDAEQLYQQHCAQCHNARRLGGMGPALLPGWIIDVAALVR